MATRLSPGLLLSLLAIPAFASSALPASPPARSHSDSEDAAAADGPFADMQLHAPAYTYLMVEALRRGGLILFVRHGIAALERDDRDAVERGDCRAQRSLSVAGRALAEEAGQAIRELQLPIGYVFTSPYCRCRETSDLMFGLGLRVADLAAPDHDDENAGKRLISVIARVPSSKANTVLVGHLPSALQLYGVTPAEGETLIIRPAQGGEGPALIGHVTATQWSDLVRDYRRYGARIKQMVDATFANEPAMPVGPAGEH